MAKPHHHVLDIYGVHLHLATDRKQLKAMLKEFGSAIENPLDKPAVDAMTAAAILIGDGTYHVAFWIDGKKMQTEDPGRIVNVVAHEAHHAASAIFGHIGEGDTDSEPFAYMVGGIAEWLYNRVPDPA